MKSSETTDPECLLQKMPCIICPSISKFWKWAGGAIVILMFIFAMTLWGMALALKSYGTDLKDGRAEIMAGINKAIQTVNEHKQLTLENRVVQSEVRGMLMEHRIKQEREKGQKGQ